jgi:Carboxypeptidase regulatory-like domain
MRGKIRLVAVVVALATVAGGVPVAGQQPLAPAFQGARASLSSSIQGTAVNWTNAALENARVRLRDARVGRAVGSTVTDRFGAFEFRGLESGSYVVELMNAGDDVVLAATPIINVGTNDTVAALVKLPFRNPPLGGAFGRSVPAVLAITTAAAAAGVLATTVTGIPATDRALPGQR